MRQYLMGPMPQIVEVDLGNDLPSLYMKLSAVDHAIGLGQQPFGRVRSILGHRRTPSFAMFQPSGVLFITVPSSLSNPVPMTVVDGSGVSLTGVVAIDAGFYHTCALMSDSTVRCWGLNDEGQLGVDTNSDTNNPNPPVPMAVGDGLSNVLSNVQSIAAGYFHTCAVMFDKSVRCWGSNSQGQLGMDTNVGAESPNPEPTAVLDELGNPLADVVAVDAGLYHTCARLSDSSLRCWGSNLNGQLGVETNLGTSNPISYAIAVTDGLGNAQTDVVVINTGYRHTCALFSDETVRCWGSNQEGQLGVATNAGTDTPNPEPMMVVDNLVHSLSGVAAIAAKNHTCSLLTEGTVLCWGSNSQGQLGIPSTGIEDFTYIPTMVQGLP